MVEYQQYFCSLETLSTTIQKYGVAIIPNVLSLEEIKKSRQEMWKYLGHLTQNLINLLHNIIQILG